MRVAPATLCLVLSSLAIMNICVFVVFRPKGWTMLRFQQTLSRLNLTMVLNVTCIPYGRASISINSIKDCGNPKGLSAGSVRVNFTSAEAYFWSASNYQALNETGNRNTTFLRFPKESSRSSRDGILMFEPKNCKNIYAVAIIVPFRDRESHLRILLGHLVPILQKQLLRYSILVMEQGGNQTFNKGRLMNTGFEIASTIGRRSEIPYDCYIFQDVDLLTEYESLLHRCAKGNVVRHLSTAINKFDYKPLCCGMTVGGVLAFTEDQFRKVNGYPNSYWGWGGEDDDINKRLQYSKIKIYRPKQPLGRYTMIKHGPDKGNPYNNNVHKNVLFALRRMKTDGLSDLNARVITVQNYVLFTKILVDVGRPA